MQYGVNTWAWKAPLTTETFERVAPTQDEIVEDGLAFLRNCLGE